MADTQHHCVTREHGWAGKSERGVVTLASPVSDEQLQVIGPTTRTVQWECPFSDDELRMVADAIAGYPAIHIRRYTVGTEPAENLGYLRHFSSSRSVGIELNGLRSLEGIESLSPDLETLSLGTCRVRGRSLAFLRRHPHIRALYIDGWVEQIETIGELRSLDTLNIRSATLANFDFLEPLQELTFLGIQRGGTRDLGVLPKLKKLKVINIWKVNGLTDLGPIGRTESLQWICLEALSTVTSLPELNQLHNLRRLELRNLKRLDDLAPLAKTPALEDLQVMSDILKSRHFEVLKGHPTLRNVEILLGSNRESAAALQAMGLSYTPFGKFVVR